MSVTAETTSAVTFEDILSAAERIRPLAHVTPLITSRLFDERAGVRTVFKCENLQRGGAFKIRGAMNFIAQLSPEERKRGIVAFSSGNHAQAVAIAAAYYGVPATIVMPTDAPKAKLQSTQSYHPRILFFDRLRDNREELAARIANDTGAIMLPSFDHPWIVAGQGTAALELLRERPDLESLIVPLGGGGLLAGTLTVARALRPDLKVFGVEPERASDWFQSLSKGERVEISPPDTIADGLRTQTPGRITFSIVRELGGIPLLVSEAEIRRTVRFLLSRLKILVEPSGAVGAAAVLYGKMPAAIRTAGVILSGGNVDLDTLAAICAEAD
ncbi:MAG TPA: pyridoxal-phosphate dependent enzyme [Bryobacteraceae bacterium]|jgi:threonine dehydratase|nr:pyridoxal-phosphate dependent enzyme [Bryobacteraceae bacterium]